MADDRQQKSNQTQANEENPEPEVLKPREQDAEEKAQETSSDEVDHKRKKDKKSKMSLRSRYHLSHKATFIGLAVVTVILAINAGIIIFVIDGGPGEEDEPSDQVTVNEEALEGLGVNRTATEDVGAVLTIGPSTSFERDVQIAGELNLGGELVLNESLSAIEISTNTLQAADATLDELNINGDLTASNFSVRDDMVVAGNTQLQGPVTLDEILTVENDVNVSNNLTVGGALTVSTFQSSNLTVDGTVTLGSRIQTRGSAPSVSAGSAVGSNGTVSISGNDASGTVGFNAGTGAGGGTVAQVSFSSSYDSTPTVVITPVGDVGSFYISRSANGFSISVSDSVDPGGYAFDYIVMQ